LREFLSKHSVYDCLLTVVHRPFTNSSVVVTSTVDLYDYHGLTLISSYGAAIFVALIANLLGFNAFWRNKVRIDKTFSWTASATQHTNLVDEEHYGRRGSIPIPSPIRGKRVVFKKIVGGGWGFEVVVLEAVPRPAKPVYLYRRLKRGVWIYPSALRRPRNGPIWPGLRRDQTGLPNRTEPKPV
jgi:hypothetical protein